MRQSSNGGKLTRPQPRVKSWVWCPRNSLTFNPAKRASPSSKTEFMTWQWRALPKSFSAKSDRMAQPAGIIFEPE